MWCVAVPESLLVNFDYFMLMRAIQRPLSKNVTIVGSGGDCYLARGRTIVVTVIIVL